MAAPKGNRYALGHGFGRPPIYAEVDELAQKIADYFEYCEGEYETQTVKVRRKRKDEESGKMKTVEVEEEQEVCLREPERPQVTGLAFFLGFDSRSTLNQYAKKEVFSYPIKRALMLIEKEYETMLPYAKGGGVIFALKNMGWEDRSQVDNTHDVKHRADWLTPKPTDAAQS